MKVLLLSGANKIGSQPIIELLHELTPRGVTVEVAMWAAATPELLATLPGLVVWGPQRSHAPVTHPIEGSTDATDFSEASESEVAEAPSPNPVRTAPRAISPQRVKAAYGWRVLRLRKAVRPYYGPARARVARPVRRLRNSYQPARAWRRVRNDEVVRHWASQADMIVAMDSQAILAVWKLARLQPDVEVVFGLSAGRGQIMRQIAV